jgi:putative peptidoglycan lipid II flippase
MEVDSLLLALIPVNQLSVIVGPALLPMLMPLFVETDQTREPAQTRTLMFSSLAVVSAVGVALALTLVAVGPIILGFLGGQLEPSGVIGAQAQMRWLSAAIAITAISYVWWAMRAAHGDLVLPNLAPSLPSLVAIAFLVLGAVHAGLWAVTAGLLIGSVVTCVVGWLAVRHQLQGNGAARAATWSPHYAKRVGTLVTMAAGISAVSILGTLSEQGFAAVLGPGNVSTINFANRVPLLVYTLVAAIASSVLLPKFTRQRLSTGGDRWAEFRRYGLLALLGSAAMAALLVLFSDYVVEAVFGRGRFTPQDVVVVADVQRVYALSLPFWAAGMVGTRLLNSSGANRTVLGITAAMYAVDFTGCWYLTPLYGAAGIAWAYLGMSMTYLLLTVIMVRRT